MKLVWIKKLPTKFLAYLKDVRKEMANVIWPTRRETVRYTLIVIGFSFTVAVLLGSLDYLFALSIRKFL